MFNLLLKYLLLTMVLFSITSCGEYDDVDCEDYDFYDCIGIEPDSFDVEILITQLNDSEKIPIWIYKGKFDIFGSQPQVLIHDTATIALYVVRLPIGHDYSAKAEYKRNTETIYAVDGVHLSKKDVSVCDSVCWEVTGKEIDVRLKE